MKTNTKGALLLWVTIVFISTTLIVSGILLIRDFNTTAYADSENEISNIRVTTKIPRVVVEQKEVEVPVEKEVEVYNFPFVVEELGVYTAQGVTLKTLPQRVYSKMKANEQVTVFASTNVVPEGTLVWIQNVGIRQVQSLNTDSTNFFIYFDNEENANEFGTQEVLVFKVME